LNRIFKEFVSGIVTARDNLVIGFTEEEVREKIETFLNPEIPDDEIRKIFKVSDNYAWSLKIAREKLRIEMSGKDIEELIKPILYRPFDVRYIFYHSAVVFRDRYKVMKHMILGENLGLVASRQVKEAWRHAFITQQIVDFNLTGRAGSLGSGYLFPLYLYLQKNDSLKKQANFTPEFERIISELYPEKPSPEEVLYYIYGVLYSLDYRERFGEYLKYEFPRIPFVREYEKFTEISRVGKELVDAHLLRGVSTEGVKMSGDNFKVKKVGYKGGKLYINKSTYFEPIEREVWEYRIGGYQVLKKWLSDRKGRELNLGEINRFRKIVNAIRKTMELSEKFNWVF